MKGLWPETSFVDVFDMNKGDPSPREPITDKYGLVSYGVDSMLAHDASLPSFNGRIGGYDFLALLDPEEHERVTRAARHRAQAVRKKFRRKDGPDWLFYNSLFESKEERLTEEKDILKKCGLTIEEALALVDKSRKEPN